MFRALLLFLLMGHHLPAFSQQQFPLGRGAAIDTAFIGLYDVYLKKDSAQMERSMELIDRLLIPLEKDFPNYTAIVELYQAFYSFLPDRRDKYFEHANQRIRQTTKIAADSFSFFFYSLAQQFNEANRLNEWMRADSALRFAVAQSTNALALRYGIGNLASQHLREKAYYISTNLARYDQITLEYTQPKDITGRLCILYDEWIVLKGDYEQWAEMPYNKKHKGNYEDQGLNHLDWDNTHPEYDHLRQIDFKKRFTELLKKHGKFFKEIVADHPYGATGFDAEARKAYWNTGYEFITYFYYWGLMDHQPGAVILPLKEFVLQQFASFELDQSLKAGKTPLLPAGQIQNLFVNLVDLYYRIGNGEEAAQVITIGQRYFGKNSLFSTQEKSLATLNLMSANVRVLRLQNKLESSLELSGLLKKYAPRPDSLNVRTQQSFEAFASIWIDEVETYLAKGDDSVATQLLINLIDSIGLCKQEPQDYVYKTKAWTRLQIHVAAYSSKRGIWKTSLLGEAVDDLEDGRTHLDIFYPAQLLYLKAFWREKNRLNASTLSNLLFHTGRQLQKNFVLLSAEDRMNLYGQQLNDYFDVYHELLFNGALDSFPELKNKVIEQSLFLKNALSDGNILPDELLNSSGNEAMQEIVEKARKLRQDVNLNLQRARIHHRNSEGSRDNQDRIQSFWLGLLEGPGMDSLIQFNSLAKITASLKPGQIYIETVRYSRWLTDSTAQYGAFVVQAGQPLKILPLFDEKTLVKLLNDPAASPQTATLQLNNSRGAKLGATSKTQQKFQPGDIDKLGQFILQPLWPLLSKHKELIVVNDGLLNRISLAALQWNKQYLINYISIRQLSGSYILSQKPAAFPLQAKAMLAGGLDYGKDPETYNRNRFFNRYISWPYLPGTRTEIAQLTPLFRAAGLSPQVYSGKSLPDSLRKVLTGFQFIHLATHGFYLDTATANASIASGWDHETIRYEPLMRCGIALSAVNNPDTAIAAETEGYLLGYELANTDLRHCYLISLSACETGLGDLRNNLGVDGLSRALKLGGARYLLISLWKVPDQPTAIFMNSFYKELFSRKSPTAALRAAQLEMSRKYPAGDWAAFILVE